MGKPNGHIRIAGEVEVYLREIRQRTDPGDRDVDLGLGRIVDGGGDTGQGVGDEYLLRKSHREAAQAMCDPVEGHAARGKLPLDIAVFDDWTGNKLREERDEQQYARIALLRRGLAAIDIYDVGQRLKGIKRYADGEREPGKRRVATHKHAERGREHTRVFEHREEAEVDQDRQGDQRLAVCALLLRRPQCSPKQPVEKR